MQIVLLRFQGVPKEVPAHLAAPLREVFGLPVAVQARALRLPAAAYSPEREQWRAAGLLSAVAAAPVHGEPAGSVRLGISAHDLFATGLNFVFGEASHASRCAVFSIARLDDAFYGLPQSSPESFLRRCCTEAVHELGHVFGLGHCRNPSCVMWFSNTLEETDRKGWRPCEHCAARLAAALLGAGGG